MSFQTLAPKKKSGAAQVKRVYQTGVHRDVCIRPREEGWFSLYAQPAKGERSMQEFEEAVLRRFEMLTVLHQEEGMERLTRHELVAEVGLAAKGALTQHCKGVFEWVSPTKLESLLLSEEMSLRYQKGLTAVDVRDAMQSRQTSGMYIGTAGSNATTQLYEEYTQELARRTSEIVDEQFQRAFEDDSIAHWACRLACCGEEKWRSWFMKHEETLFRGRVAALSTFDQQALLKRHTGLQELSPGSLTSLNIRELLAEMEVKQERLGIIDASTVPSAQNGQNGAHHPALRNIYYGVDFTSVPALLRSKIVIIKGGVAYVNHNQALTVLYDKFKEELEVGLMDALRARPDVEAKEQDRVSAFLSKALFQSLNVINRGANVQTGPAPEMDIEDIAAYADTHMPLCMRMMDRTLRRDRHLKFDGRFQYGVFLKDAGLSLENMMKFLSETMTLRTSTAKFAKSEYGYSVRFWYGKEGKKTSYNALNCSTLTMGAAPKAGQVHGCPFKHSSEAKLKQMIKEPRPYGKGATAADGQTSLLAARSIQVKDSSVTEILKKVSTGHHPAACREYFVQTHPGYPKDSSLFISPNHYLQTSLDFHNGVTEEQKNSNSRSVPNSPAPPGRRSGYIG